MKVIFFGEGVNLRPLAQKVRIWAEMSSNGQNITSNRFYDPKTHENMYHTSRLIKKHKKNLNWMTSFGAHFCILPIKKGAHNCHSGNQARLVQHGLSIINKSSS